MADRLADAALIAAKDIAQIARRHRGNDDFYLQIVERRAAVIVDEFRVQLGLREHGVALDLPACDARLADVLDRAMIRYLMIRVEQMRGPIGVSKAQILIAEGTKALAFARARQFFAFAAEIASSLAALCSKIGLFEASDGFLCQMQLNRTRALTPMKRLKGYVAYALAGYGYRPYNLVVVLATLLVVNATILMRVAHWDFRASLVEVAWNYLAFGAPSNFDGVPQAMRIYLVAQSLAAIVVNGTLVALLGRKWFRNA